MESLLFYISEVSIIASSLDTELKKVKKYVEEQRDSQRREAKIINLWQIDIK